jgi:hypothetical protein
VVLNFADPGRPIKREEEEEEEMLPNEMEKKKARKAWKDR